MITIHQPQYLPWLPYFAKILPCDTFIFLDQVAFQKNGVQNRNEIKTANGRTMLTIPVKQHLGQLIKDTAIALPLLAKKHLKTIEMAYKKSPFFDEIMTLITPILTAEHDNLCKLNCALTKAILNYLKFTGEILFASKMDIEGSASELIRNICIASNSNHYLSGQGGKNYMDLDDFKKHNIQVSFHQYSVQPYSQLHPKLEFMPDLSVLDLLFNLGPKSREHIEKGQIPCEIF